MTLHLRLNGEAVTADVPADTFLLGFLRDRGLTGTKEACGVGVCGACTALVDGEPVSACLYLAAAADGADVWTVEGIARKAPHIAAAFAENEGLQCGICTPGQVVATYALLQREPHPDDAAIRDHLAGNLCRCTGYASIRRSVVAAAGGSDGDG